VPATETKMIAASLKECQGKHLLLEKMPPVSRRNHMNYLYRLQMGDSISIISDLGAFDGPILKFS